MTKEYYSNGKLLLTGEYAVLDGAIALSIPTKYGQSLKVEKTKLTNIHWKSFDENNELWYETNLLLKNNELTQIANDHNPISKKLIEILHAAKNLNPDFLTDGKGCNITTKLNFPRDWGLGTSSTLINNIAQWANVDAYKLLQISFGGSGYDIASAKNNTPILYQLENSTAKVSTVNLNWNFKDHLFFVYLNKKQNSHSAITSYQLVGKPSEKMIQDISNLTLKIAHSTSLNDFKPLIEEHEKCISELIQQKTIKEVMFKDFKGVIKSLGAWGGDFILATGNEIEMDYFRKKGYTTLIPFDEMILK